MSDPRIAKLREIDNLLAEKGWPKISPWWWNVIETFYESGVLGCVIQGGRRGGKSATIAAKVAVAELLTTVDGPNSEQIPLHNIGPDDVGYFGMVSAEKGQAKARLSTTKKALRALGFAFEVANTEELQLKDSRLGVKAITASKEGVVSFTCIGFLADEMALWSDDEGNNPATEVIESLKPTMLTMPNARAWYISAPWAELGLHWQMFDAGDDETQRVFHGASWEMNPTITEAQTHLMEKDLISWMRAYAAVAMKSDESKFFSSEFIDLCAGLIAAGDAIKQAVAFRTFRAERVVAGGDFAFRRDSSAMVTLAKGGDLMRVTCAEERTPGLRALVPSATITELSKIARQHGADALACDMHYIESVREHTDALGLELLEYPSHQNDRWYVQLRIALSEQKIDLRRAPPELLDQLKACTSKPLDGGRLKIEVKRSASLSHGDILSALVCAVWALEQPVPEEQMVMGSRRFQRGGNDNDGPGPLTDLPPPDWD